MFSTLARCALGAALLVGAVSAQSRNEIVPVTTTNPALNGFEARVGGVVTTSQVVVGYTAWVGSFAFGNGTVVSIDYTDGDAIEYSSNGFDFKLSLGDGYTWAAWCYDIGDALFQVFPQP